MTQSKLRSTPCNNTEYGFIKSIDKKNLFWKPQVVTAKVKPDKKHH